MGAPVAAAARPVGFLTAAEHTETPPRHPLSHCPLFFLTPITASNLIFVDLFVVSPWSCAHAGSRAAGPGPGRPPMSTQAPGWRRRLGRLAVPASHATALLPVTPGPGTLGSLGRRLTSR